MKIRVESTVSNKINDRSIVALAGIAELPLHIDLMYTHIPSLPQIFPIPGLHITVDHRALTKVEEHFLTRIFGQHAFPLHLSAIGSSFYSVVEWTDTDYFTELLHESLGCSSWTTDAYQAHFQLANSSHSHFRLKWIGETSCSLEYDHSDTSIAPKVPITSEVRPNYGYHSNLVLGGAFESIMVLGLLKRDFFMDPYEVQRIDFSPFEVKIIGSVDLEVPVSSPKAMLHAFTLTGKVQNGR
jgi:hypothetical protein